MKKKAMLVLGLALALMSGTVTAKASEAGNGVAAETDAVSNESAESREGEVSGELLKVTNLRWEGEYAVWDPVSGAEYYRVEWYKDGEAFPIKPKSTETRARIPSVQNGVYKFSVTACSIESDIEQNIGYSESEELVIDRPLFEGGQLPTPTGLRWIDDWGIEWDRVPEAHGNYHVEVYKDGEFHDGWWMYSGDDYDRGNDNLSQIIFESGIYTWRIQALNEYDTEHYTDSEWSEFCEEKEYVKPAKVLGTLQGHWSSTVAGRFIIEEVPPESDWLDFELYDEDCRVSSDGVSVGYLTEYFKCEEGYFYDYSDEIDSHGDGQYRVRIRAYSNNIDEIANGEWGDFSEYFYTSNITQIVGGKISDAISSTESASDTLAVIKDEIANDALRMSMQTDDSVREQIKNLEASYIAENGISVGKTEIIGEANTYVKAEDISLVGAGLNAETGQSVKLEISVPEKKEYVSSQHYADSVQLDIRLKRDEESVHELQIPITITLPIPGGLDTSRLVILHYDENGGFETVMPKINGDGTVTFTLTRFSTFVFAEEKAEEQQLNGWHEEGGREYWYEDGVKQGTEGRGKEIYDPDSDAWYWLDAVQGGAKAVSKDVYQESNGGKWVRYDADGHMIKGWQETEAGTYYFDLITGAMYKGNHNIDGTDYYFDETTGILGQAYADGWNSINGVEYWYENGVRQGYAPENPAYRGKEIYDPGSDAWYWLDNVQQGAKAVSKDVYQESYSAYPDREDGTGKWVRYDGNGHMVKGWQITEAGTYYFEEITGAMAKGQVTIDGNVYYFDEVTGILK